MPKIIKLGSHLDTPGLTPGSLRVAPGETSEKLSEKMESITQREQEQATQAEAAARGMPYIDLTGFPIAPEVLSLFSEERAAQLQTVPFFKNDEELRLATTKPDDPEVGAALAELTEHYRVNGMLYLVSSHSIERALRLYKNIPHPKQYSSGVEITEAELMRFRSQITSFRDIQGKLQGVSMTQMFVMILAGGIEARSTDVHIEAEEKSVTVRYRVDGVLQDIATLDKAVWPKLISRVKLLARLKINIADVPQDGRFTIYLSKERIEVRVSTLPTAWGESIVMRLLSSSAVQLTFDSLGLRGQAATILQEQFKRPNGMIITTGPTGSGKTTTLYAILKELNTPERKIITLEDPIEYKIEGISQSQIRESQESDQGGSSDLKKLLKGGAGAREYTFARGLRSILRQDPDIIMVGEIRDEETAGIAIQAALTGHLVLSTIHTNSAAGAIPRFIAMEVKPFLLAPALNAIVAQRLIRKICTSCSEPVTLTDEERQRVREAIESLPESDRPTTPIDQLVFRKGRGCDTCFGLGYKGRVGIYELLTLNEEIEQMILTAQVSEMKIERSAVGGGMITMLQDGILKAIDGLTTLEEVFKEVDLSR